MKKKFVALATGLLLVGIASTHASAEEYQVEKGDTLWEIAHENEITVDDLKESNNLATDIIFPGQLLQIDKDIVYTVKAGDTLSELAEEYQVTVEDLKVWNALPSDLILIDQSLVIKEVKQATNETQTKAVEVSNKSKTNSTEEKKDDQQKTLTVTATAYTAECDGCSGITATGIDLRNDRDKKVIAVDPNVIPLGTRVYVEGYGEAIAGDTGGAIKGNKIDIHVPTKDEAYQWGVRTVKVTILG
ncbi:Cell wall-binding protein YocH precursor [Paraliobacillus sp. PM-2]|uniref:LysM peptidoglycan-binding and 3D domain-containing protein n=1 Tax=Paraliobacillus sp. PM-2 TaxID=1462524 RepID=UPI00061BA09F|nr:3D domain-containing protein [Paraliobacillus sp. PM-2]CQR46069.1 Cell wall-binding protein YocH precursor [Paraliobacillus sp. PM-2]